MKNIIMVNAGNKDYIMETTNTRKTRALVKEFIERLAKYRKFCPEMVERLVNDEETIKRIQYEMTFATMEHRTTDNGTKYFNFTGKGFQMNFPFDEYDKYIIEV